MANFHCLIFLIFLLLLLQIVNPANILFLFGGGNISQKISIWPLVMALTDKGHNITVVSTGAKQPRPNPKVTDLVPSFWQKSTGGVEVDRIQNRKDGKVFKISTYETASLKLCREMMNSQDDPIFTNLIENGQFDLVVANAIFGECNLYFAHHFRAKYVIFQSTFVYTWFHSMFGLQLETSWIPDFLSHVQYPMDFWARLKAMFTSVMSYRNAADFEEGIRGHYMKRFGLNEAPTLIELQRNASLVLVNSHFTVDFARALPPMFIDVGGMQSWEPEGILPLDFKEFMDSFQDGVILISFGSSIKFNKLPQTYVNMFFNMMRQFPKVGFIWRWEGPLPENQPINLMPAEWLPQREILGHKSVRAFMSHGGMNGMLEATHGAVPIICMPLFGDQDLQAYRVEAHEIGVRVEAATLSQETLDGAIYEILTNSKYKTNMKRRSELFRDRPNPTETAVHAVEFVLKHDDLSPMKPMDLDQSFWVRQHLDIYFFCFLIFAAINVLIPVTIIWICRRFCSN